MAHRPVPGCCALTPRNLERRSITNGERKRDGVHFFLFTLPEAQHGLIIAGFCEDVLRLIEPGIAACASHADRSEFRTAAFDGDLGVFQVPLRFLVAQ